MDITRADTVNARIRRSRGPALLLAPSDDQCPVPPLAAVAIETWKGETCPLLLIKIAGRYRTANFDASAFRRISWSPGDLIHTVQPGAGAVIGPHF